MSISAEAEARLDGERVIDRSGDIDQRPLEERSGEEPANTILLSSSPRRGEEHSRAVLRYEAAPPPPRREAPPPGIEEIVHHLQRDLDRQYAKAKAQLDSLAQKICAQEKRCVPPKLDAELQQIRFQRQKVLIANGPLLADRLREEKSRRADLETFKAANRLSRDAHYPSSPVLAFGILAILVLAEAGIDGVLFADGSDLGLLGGWLEALVLSITNVGTAFLFGRIALSQLHRPAMLAKAGAVVLCTGGAAALIAVNLIGAHYRDFRMAAANAESPAPVAIKHEASLALSGQIPVAAGAPQRKAGKPAAPEPPPLPQVQTAQREKVKEPEAMAKALASPFTFDSFLSFFLFVIGLCGAAIAALDGYKLDDPFPGYGKRHRKYAVARAQSGEALRRILSQSNAIMTGSFQDVARKIECFAEEMAALLALHHAYAGVHKALRDGLEEAARGAEAQIAAYGRLMNKIPAGGASDFYAVAVKQLPALGEKQVKFYETQEKKLKALQKNAQREQSDILSIFESSGADFAKLLARASHASLQAALIAAPEGDAGA